jgi:hypothetical protein
MDGLVVERFQDILDELAMPYRVISYHIMLIMYCVTSLAALGRWESHVKVEERKSASCVTISCGALGSVIGSY